MDRSDKAILRNAVDFYGSSVQELKGWVDEFERCDKRKDGVRREKGNSV